MADARRHGVPASLVMVDVGAATGQPSVGHHLATRIAAQRRLTDDAAILFGAGNHPAVGTAISQVALLVPGGNSSAVPFSMCLQGFVQAG